MQIACPACAATYEFDERRVGPEGIALRCSACGHLFQYARLEAAVVPGLRVRRVRTGEVSLLPDEQAVRRSILDRRLERNDLVSRTGQHWIALGDSPDYSPYFRVADEMGPVRPASAQRPPPAPGQTRDLEAVIDLDLAPSQAGATRAMRPAGATPRDVAVVAASAATPPAQRAARRAATPPPPPVNHPARPRLETAHIEAARSKKADRYTLGASDLPIDDDAYELSGARSRAPAWDEQVLDIPDTAPVRTRRPTSAGPGLGAAIVIGGAIVLSTCLLLWFAVPSFRTSLRNALGMSAPAPAPTALAQAASAAPAAADDGAAGAGSGHAQDEPPDAPTASQSAAPAAPTASDDRSAGTAAPLAPAPASAPRPTHPDAPQLADLAPVNPPPGTVTTAAAPPADTIDALLRRGNDALGAGNLELALEAFSAAADRFDRAEAHVGMARTFVRMGRDELAVARYERATLANPRYQPAWLEYGDVLRESGDAAGAIAAYERVLAIRDAGTAAARARSALDELRGP